MEELTREDLVRLIQSVFPHLEQDHFAAVLVDIPRTADEDNESWKERRHIASEWAKILREAKSELKCDEVRLLAYPGAGSHNADLPETLFALEGRAPDTAEGLNTTGIAVPRDQALAGTQIFLAPTEYSATAPLKLAARKYGFRAATMPGFCAKMIPSLRLDYAEVARRVEAIKRRLDPAKTSTVEFRVDGRTQCEIFFDLRFRQGHASIGRFGEPGAAGNLPGGECYIVPHEGDHGPSETRGVIPVQFGEDMVFYRVERNRAISVEGEGEAVKQESKLISREPGYCNIAELGFGVLADFGLQPIGEILLDEKLGFHIAFGRSDHFGGIVGPAQFSSSQAVVHIDRIYIPSTQPRVCVKAVTLTYEDGRKEQLMRDGKYLIF